MNEFTNSSAIETEPVPPELIEPAPVALNPILPETASLPVEPPPLPSPIRPIPIQESERFITLDVVRGMALCGILLVNMESFAMIREARYDPTISGGDSRLDHLIWQATYLFADTKFIAIFTMLFGAGIASANDRRRNRETRPSRVWDYRSIPFLIVAALVFREYVRSDSVKLFLAYWGLWASWVFVAPKPEAVHYRRMLFLAAVGAVHGLFLWRGDILYFYAFWGLALYFAPRFPTPLLLVAGVGIYAHFVGLFSQQMLDASDGVSWWERSIFRGHWIDQYHYRVESEDFYVRLLPIEFSTHLFGLMLTGMALYKSGFLTGRWPTWIYGALSLISLPLGGYFVADGTQLGTHFANLFAAKEFVWGSLALSLGYMSATITLTKWIGPRWGLGGFAAMGRMAFTNYLMQTIVCTTIFYGYGFGLFERLSRTDQTVILVGILTYQMIFSVLWLKFFRFGPLEWIWRCFSYWRLQPLLRPRTPPAGIAAAP